MMKYSFIVIISAITVMNLSSCKKEPNTPITPVVKPNLVFYGITATGQLSKYNANAAETAISTVSISGLQAGESILSIDFRPATGELYGLGSTSRLYIINTTTGNTRVVGTDAFTPALSGNISGFDFNPTVDRIRIVTSTGQNIRLNPETGIVAATDGNINGVTGLAVNAVAYTNSKAGAAATTLFDIDVTTQKLYRQSPPNNGTLVEVGSLGVTPTGDAGFDISPDNTVALASMYVAGKSSLFQIDTATGMATKLGDFAVTDIVNGIAIPTQPVAYAVDEMNNFLIFNPTSTDAPVLKSMTGLLAGDAVHGIDFRPLNGQIFALGKAGNLYAINSASGAATLVGAGSFALLTGAYFGFDFNPTVDRIRVISSSGQNLRINPLTGAIAATDLNLNPGTPNVSAAAYSNNFAGATTTVLYDIDCALDKLYTQVPPNNGTLVEVGSLGVNIESANGFDIGSASGIAYAVFTVGGNRGIFSVNLTTGAATKLVDFPKTVRGFTIGLGF
ncbi:MAG: DUF4394 domain-containing protein [Chitinophagaceae bacterium]|nr:DUF4394 domain-containing protein [Chitinophagaceae bacterium]